MLIRVGTMEVDVEVREVRSWEVKVLLRNEASVSDTKYSICEKIHLGPN